jgi:putative Holliday junction resolvase
MDGTEGPRAEKTRRFAQLLGAASGLEVVFWDERRSSVEAHAILHAGGKKMKKHRETVDAVAASLILEGYLGRQKRRKRNKVRRRPEMLGEPRCL